FKGVNWDYTNRALKADERVRLPIIINGVGPAGLILAIGLKNANIPFHICERHRHDLDLKSRRNHMSQLSAKVLKPLRHFLQVHHYASILDEIRITPRKPGVDPLKQDHAIYTESLMEILRRQVNVNYGFKLEKEGISWRESFIDAEYITGKKTSNLWAWPAIAYVSTVMVSRKAYNSDFRTTQASNNNSTSQLIGNTRFVLNTNRVTSDQVNMSLWYSRLAATDEDYRTFFGISPGEQEIPRVGYHFDERVKDEIELLRNSLHPTLAMAFDCCKHSGVSQKWLLNAIRFERRDYPTEVFRGETSMPAVLIGDAAHARPGIFAPDDMSWAMLDAFDLCHLIVERYKDDKLFLSIPYDYYDLKARRWERLHLEWEGSWHAAHGLQHKRGDAKFTWVNIVRARKQQQRTEQMADTNLDDLSERSQRKVQQFLKGEEARWALIQEKINSQFERSNAMKYAFQTKPQDEPTELVLRYLDSISPQPDNYRDMVENSPEEHRIPNLHRRKSRMVMGQI
ncbi:MAG: hypothetical protein Q9226_008756, partial [Calogaya cf. arnoldii]